MKKVATGIFKTPFGFRAYVDVPDAVHRTKYRTATKRFPRTATVTEMKRWREDTRVDARKRRPPTPYAGTLAQDIERYLKQVAAMPSIKDRQRDLRAWAQVFGDLSRSALTVEMIRGELQKWRTEGPAILYVPKLARYDTANRPLSASACNHRRTALLHLYAVLDGPDAPNPVKRVPPFKEPPPEPRGRDLAFLASAVARLRNPKQRARAQVLLWTGMRGNSELAKMKPEHVDLEHQVCYVPTGKGSQRFRIVPLNEKGIAAWQAFIAVKAWGKYDKDALRKSINVACRNEAKARGIDPFKVRSYDLRHSTATAYLNAGADLADVQELLGHTTSRMTRRYAPYQVTKLAAIGTKL